MTLDEIDRIRESFVETGEGICPEVAALMTVMKYHGVEKQASAAQLTEWCGTDENGNISLKNISDAATRLGMQTEACILDLETLADLKLPLILFMWNEYGKPVYDVCYGIHEGRFILWDSDWGGPRQYWPYDMEILWIKGIALRLYPSIELMQKADHHIKWWQLYDWTKWLKRRWDWLCEQIELEVIPLFR